MKFSLWTQYGALNSKPVFDAFSQGARSLGFDCVVNSDNSDIDVIWSVLFSGRMAGNKAIWEKNAANSKPTIVLEVGGIQRGTTWKVGLNGINRDAYFGPNNNNDTRNGLLGLSVKPWRTDGEYILICGQHDRSLQWQGMPSMSTWVMNTIDEIRTHTDRPIVFRPHPRCPLPNIEYEFKNVSRQSPIKLNGTYDDFDMRFDRVHATVSWSSNPGIHSVLNGVPSFVGPSSLAYDVSIKTLANIDNPPVVDRQQWLNDYAHTEWTVNEISKGIPLKRLTNRLI
jgi:hypothetical protein